MCGRFALFNSAQIIKTWFHLPELNGYQPSYNIAPSSQVLTIVARAEKNLQSCFMHWGFIPTWANATTQKLPRPINARIETVQTNGLFKHAIKKSRCLILATGYYEWQQQTDGKQPYFIRSQSTPDFLLLAGIYAARPDDEPSMGTCAILTQPAYTNLSDIHKRMPVIIHPNQFTDWLCAPFTPGTKGIELIHHCQMPAENLTAYPVTSAVNTPRFNQPECVEPLLDDSMR